MLNINVVFVGIKENNGISTNPFVVDAMVPIMAKHLNVRVGEHPGVSPLTGKKSKVKTTAAIKDHILFCDQAVSLKFFKFWQEVILNFILRSKKVF